MPRIDEMYAFVTEDSGPGDEGVAAFIGHMGPMPMVAADKARVDSLMGIAQQMADKFGKPIKLIRFSVREEMQTIEPRATGHP